MATTKKKVVIWSKELEKATGKYDKKMLKLFDDFEKEVSRNPMSLRDRNDLWRKKYQPKFEILEKKEDAAYAKLWNKYYDKSTYKPRSCYVIK